MIRLGNGEYGTGCGRMWSQSEALFLYRFRRLVYGIKLVFWYLETHSLRAALLQELGKLEGTDLIQSCLPLFRRRLPFPRFLLFRPDTLLSRRLELANSILIEFGRPREADASPLLLRTLLPLLVQPNLGVGMF